MTKIDKINANITTDTGINDFEQIPLFAVPPS